MSLKGGDLPEILTIEQAAEYLQLHPQVVYRHVRAGTLPASRIGRTIRFKKSVLDAWLEKDAWSSVGKFLAFVQKAPRASTAPETPAAKQKPTSELPDTPRHRVRFQADVD